MAPSRSTAARKSAGGIGVELRGRLVEEQQRRLERERRGEADALQLPAGELDRLPAPEVERVDGVEGALDPRPDLRRRDAEVLEPERDLVRRDRHHDLVLRILEDRRHRPGELGRPGAARVEAGDHDPAREAAAVEVRHEAGERAEQGRLARPGGPEQRDDLARRERRARRRAAPAARPGTRTRGR